MKKMICIVGVIFLCLPVFAQPTLRRVVILGSSTAAGGGASTTNNGWAFRLRDYYNNTLHMPVTFHNLAVTGYNVYRGMPTSYVPPSAAEQYQRDPLRNVSTAYELLADVPVASNGVVIVNYPSNWLDFYPIADIMQCFRTIRDSAVRRGNRCYISTTQPRDEGLFVQPTVRAKMKEIRDSIVQQFGQFSLDFWTPLADPDGSMKDALKADNIHTNDAGHLALFNVVQAVDLFGSTSLPLTWGDFTTRIQIDQVQLNWSTFQEENTSHFVVEHSIDGRAYKQVGSVAAAGHSSVESKYTFTHTQPNLQGNNFYRLKQVDLDGRSSLSVIRTVQFKNNKGVAVKLTPNPVQQIMQANVVTNDISLTIIDGNGRIVKKELLQPGVHPINLGALPAGQYKVVIYQKGKWMETQEIIKL